MAEGLDPTPPTYTPDLKSFNDKNQMKSAVRGLVMDNNRVVSNISVENVTEYEEGNIANSKKTIFRQCVADLMLEFYGCQKREFGHEKEVKERYGVTDSAFDFVRAYGNIALANANHTKQYTGDGSGMDEQPEAVEVNEMQNKVESNPKAVADHKLDVKKRIGQLTIELLDAKTDIDKQELEIAITNLKKILSSNSK